VVSYFLRYFSSISTEQISPDSTGPFTSFDPVGFAIFAAHAQVWSPSVSSKIIARFYQFCSDARSVWRGHGNTLRPSCMRLLRL
jgi:hypothetical protein